MRQLAMFQVDAFADAPFKGNPAAVVPLDAWLDDATMQSIALENNLSETAFFVREPKGWAIRWFTPKSEIDLCGHATLASAWVMWNRLGLDGEQLELSCKSGMLKVTRDGDRLALHFPTRAPTPIADPPKRLIEALGGAPREVLAARDYLVVYESESDVRALSPNMNALCELDRFGFIVTAPGTDVDFVSRFFAPAKGVPEDPVTGSAHCTLIPHWSSRLGKRTLRARQISARTGELWCEQRDDGVIIAGHVVPYLEGSISVP